MADNACAAPGIAARPDDGDARRFTFALWALTLLAVTYGSLYPLQFVAPPSLWAAWVHMLLDAGWWEGGGDVVANVVLFVPVGALSWLVLERRAVPKWRRTACVLLGGFAFGFALQVGQLWLPRRWPQLSDAVWNSLGLLVGILLAPALREPLRRLARIGGAPHRAGLAVGAVWLALAWWPLVPVLNRSQLRWAWHEIQRSAEASPTAWLAPALGISVALHLLRRAPWRAAAAIALPALAVAGQFLFKLHPSPAGQPLGWLLGAILGSLSWLLPARASDTLMVLGASAAWLVHALLPWSWADTASNVSWVPLQHALADQRVARTLALGWQLFWCAAVMIGTRRLGLRPGAVAATLSVLLLGLELAQRWMPAQHADITPVLLPMLCLWALRVIVPGGSRR